MLGIISSFLVIYAAFIVVKPLLHYFRDENGLRKYPGEDFYYQEVGRKHELFHTKRIH